VILYSVLILSVFGSMACLSDHPWFAIGCFIVIWLLVYRDWCYMEKVEKHLHDQIKALRDRIDG
jgi:hypothetical protein